MVAHATIGRGSSDRMRVVLADDHPLFREGLRSLLEARPAPSPRPDVEGASALHVQNGTRVAACAIRQRLVGAG